MGQGEGLVLWGVREGGLAKGQVFTAPALRSNPGPSSGVKPSQFVFKK